MMKKIVGISLICWILLSCQDKTAQGASEQSIEQSEEKSEEQGKEKDVKQSSTTDAVNATIVELNDGERWMVNQEMKPFVIKGEASVEQYVANKQTDYHALAEAIKDQNTQLIKSCTMQGRSHDELHKWLHPHLQLVNQLEKAVTIQEANEAIQALQQSYKAYHTYFQ